MNKEYWIEAMQGEECLIGSYINATSEESAIDQFKHMFPAISADADRFVVEVE